MSLPHDFFDVVRKTAAGEAQKAMNVQAATVMAIENGRPKIRLDEADSPSPKMYRMLKSYTPQVGERVMLINNIIIGGIT